METVTLISEIFRSLQGEGIHIGEPTIFVRFYGCSQNCVWCDEKEKKGHEMTVKQIIETVISLGYGPYLTSVCLTGGEPMEQQKSVLSLLNWFPDKELSMETNGNFYNQEIAQKLRYVALSPKLSNAGFPILYHETWKRWQETGKTELKVVVDGNVQDKKEVEELRIFLRIPRKHRNYIGLMPCNTTTTKEVQEIIDWCIEDGYKFVPRLQEIYRLR